METTSSPLKPTSPTDEKVISFKAKFFMLWGVAFTVNVIMFFSGILMQSSYLFIKRIFQEISFTNLTILGGGLIIICLAPALILAFIVNFIKLKNKKIKIAAQATIIILFDVVLFRLFYFWIYRALYLNYS